MDNCETCKHLLVKDVCDLSGDTCEYTPVDAVDVCRLLRLLSEKEAK